MQASIAQDAVRPWTARRGFRMELARADFCNVTSDEP
jgi:hypothetical protein